MTTKDIELKDSGERITFAGGAMKEPSGTRARFELVPWEVIRELAEHYARGALKYADRNWEKGITIMTFMCSAFRHLEQFLRGETDEPHLISALWHIAGARWTLIRIADGSLPESLDDRPVYGRKDSK